MTVEDFADRAEAFYAARCKAKPATQHAWGVGSDAVDVLEEHDPAHELEIVAAARRWQAELSAAGFGWLDGPVELGGAGLGPEHVAVLADLESRYDVPDTTALLVGKNIVGPALVAHGVAETVREIMPRIYDGTLISCQLFSEPDAGSDLASLTTRAERVDDGWRITGRKVWTSGAHYSDVGEVIARTGTAEDRHKGLTVFLIDMHQPGVEVRPLRQMTGGASFNEVWFDDAFVPDARRIGPVNGGWKVVLDTLAVERSNTGLGRATPDHAALRRVRELVERWPSDAARRDFVHSYVASEVLRLTAARYERGGDEHLDGCGGSVTKLLFNRKLNAIARTASSVLGPRLVADDGSWGTYAWSKFVLGAPGMRIAGGTEEIQRNILAERSLGLPR